ncbi:MAG: sugar-binding transcriptional regulator [Anaerolineales bacterium]|nr:sugar-binding transcriptional regulator [Anaerolineales bacterium]
MENQAETQLLTQVARLYYKNDLTQQQIARRMGITRQKVSRLLKQAREVGIVHISIRDPQFTDHQLEDDLKQVFNLDEVILACWEEQESPNLRNHLGILAAEHIHSVLRDEMVIGIGWGRTLFEVVSSFPKNNPIHIHVTPLIGGIGDMAPFFQVNELARRMAEAFSGSYRFLHVPAFTSDADTHKALMKTQEVERVQGLWNQLDLAIVGIGHVELQQISSMFFADHMTPGVLAQLEAKGAVGDICGRFFDSDGKPVTLGAGVIGIELERLRSVPKVIAIAGGLEKVRALLGALRGGLVKTLVTDTATAREVLVKHRERR